MSGAISRSLQLSPSVGKSLKTFNKFLAFISIEGSRENIEQLIIYQARNIGHKKCSSQSGSVEMARFRDGILSNYGEHMEYG